MRWLLTLCLALPLWGRFDLVTPAKTAKIFVAADETGPIRLATADLVNDVRKITGGELTIVGDRSACGSPCVVIGRTGQPGWERYRISNSEPGVLRLEGSDERGTIFAIYAFAERFLGVDPLYFWSGREPHKRAAISFDNLNVEGGEPTFRYRGWFINDEDLLTEWKDGGGKRNIDYPYYHQVTHPDVLAKVYEAALRLRFNLIIPASFTDIANPAEEHMVRDATARGLMVSMHHVEPMGVSAFAFANYWKARGKTVPYTFHSQRAAFEEVWRFYARKWAQYPGVVWQLGLRGIADRPAWHHDPSAPRSDEARGAMISDAMALQWDIIRSVDPRPAPPATTTLWMEGAELNRLGLLKIPEAVTVVFADNTPGWKMQADFFETPRLPQRTYGIYYHHAVWGWGPHLVQGVSPHKTHEIFRDAAARNSSHYAILNVSNVREFVLGLAASSEMLRDLRGFDPDRFLTSWCKERFGRAAPQAEAAYRRFFAAYYVDPQTGTPALLDGTSLSQGRRLYTSLLRRLQAKPDEPKTTQPPAENLGRFMPNMPNPGSYPLPRLLETVQRQKAEVEAAGAGAAGILAAAPADGRALFENNFVAQQKIFAGILGWLEAAILATQSGDRTRVEKHVREGLTSFARIREGQALASRGMWRDWYRGDRKMNLASAEQLTRQVLDQLRGTAGKSND